MHIIITGFMGTGKSTVAKLLAQKLGLPFVDTDNLVEQKAGRTIAEIFAADGEEAFRRLEAEVFRQTLEARPAVIATGGGTLLDPQSRHAAKQHGTVICLLAGVDEVLKRIGHGAAAAMRPLLDRDPGNLRRRLAQRAAAYGDACHAAVDTSGLTPAQVVQRVAHALEQLGRYGRREVNVGTSVGSYQVQIGFGLLAAAGLNTAAVIKGRSVLVVTDEIVAELYLDDVVRSYHNAGFQVSHAVVPAGEQAKSAQWLQYLYDAAIDAGLDRKCGFVALGGGVIGDLAGFAAATYMRGVPVVQIPTTLLAQIDASVGGKTAINHPRGKNLIGAFHPPSLVICDLDVLGSLPQREWKAGLAEAVKHGILSDAGYFDWIEENYQAIAGQDPDKRMHLVARSVEIKAGVVTADERESGLRATLNLGHTVGHAIETCLDYRDLLHGEAVAIGLVAAARIAERMELLSTAERVRVEKVLVNLGLPTRLPAGLNPEAIMAATATDKKRMDGRQRWVLPVTIGKVLISDEVPEDVVLSVLQSIT